jgi:hypothetical protein
MCLSKAFRPEISFTPPLRVIYHLKKGVEMMDFRRDFFPFAIYHAKPWSGI